MFSNFRNVLLYAIQSVHMDFSIGLEKIGQYDCILKDSLKAEKPSH